MKTVQENTLWILMAMFAVACSGRGNVDLSKATPIGADPVNGTGPNGTYNPTTDGDQTQYSSLFSYQPGQVVNRKAGAIIDQTGTSLNEDYDGDGIRNDKEVLSGSSPWVADYARVEASIAPPVTMTIAIELNSSGSSDQISNDITSDDFEDNRDKGTENIHRNEMGVRTTQIQDKYSGSSESSRSVNTSSSSGFEAKAGYGTKDANVFSLGGGGKSSSSSGNSWSQASSFNKTVTTFPDAPATNNLDRDAWSVKANSAAKNARKYRNEKSGKVNQTSIVRPDAGKVRAALYIKNFSVNMPVKLSNILCTLMFETPTGQLIPMQSFRLRNDDYSLFTVNLYGGSEFGPYVIELANLNTNEVENAIKLGYNPKIYIVDYDMSHVPNSNYKAALPGVIGDNVKIVEENAKGRTALIKVKGQGVREMYRVAAFSLQNAPDSCTDTGGNYLPGVTLENALKRLNCAYAGGRLDGVGTDFEAGDYIIDLSDVYPNLPAEKIIMVHGIKQLAGIQTNVPCKTTETKTGTDNVTRNVCRVKKVSEMTTEELNNFGMWIVFANGKYYSHSDYIKTTPGGNVAAVYDNTNLQSEKMLQGVSSLVWAGDNYDLIYVSLTELINLSGRYGSNPLETGASLAMTTKWDSTQVGGLDTKYQPDKFSVFLGKAGKDDQVELTFDLKANKKLDYIFTQAQTQLPGSTNYNDFSYVLNSLSTRFDLINALQFEVNFGSGGNKTDWADITDTAKLPPCNGTSTLDASIDFVAQRFTVCFKVPASPYDYTASGTPALQNIYLRPKLLDEYRSVIWPEKKDEVKKFKAYLNIDTASGANVIQVANVVGTIAVGDSLTIGTSNVQHQIQSILADAQNPSLINLTVTPVLPGSRKQFDKVKAVTPALPASLVNVAITDNFYSTFNTYLAGLTPYSDPLYGCSVPTSGSCNFYASFSAASPGLLGLTYNNSNINWVGHNIFAKDVFDLNANDASRYNDFLKADLGNLIKVPGTPNEKLTLNLNKTLLKAGVQSAIAGSATQMPAIDGGSLRTFVFNGKLMAFWYEMQRDNNQKVINTRLMGSVKNLSTNATSLPIELVRVPNTWPASPAGMGKLFEAVQKDDSVYLIWQAVEFPDANTTTINTKLRKVRLSVNQPLSFDLENIVSLESSSFGAGYGYSVENLSQPILAVLTDDKSTLVFTCMDYFGNPSKLDFYSTLTEGVQNSIVLPISQYTNGLATSGNAIVTIFRADQYLNIQRYDLSGQVVTVGAVTPLAPMDNGSDVINLPKIAYKDNRAIIAWTLIQSYYTYPRHSGGLKTVDYTADVQNPQVSASTELQPGGSQWTYITNIAIEGNYGVVFWNTYDNTGAATNQVVQPVIGYWDLSTLQRQAFDVDQASWGDTQNIPWGNDMKCKAGYCYLAWANGNFQTTSPYAIANIDIYFNYLDLNTGSLGQKYKMTDNSFGMLPSIALNDTDSGPKQIVTWYRLIPNVSDNTRRIDGLSGNFMDTELLYGLNNFFTAPLIERNYTVTAKLR